MSENEKVEKRDFLVEIGTEELPPKALRELELAFVAGVRKALLESTLSHGDVLSYATPRRIAVLVKRLTSRQPEQDVKRRGPPVAASFDATGAPTRAASAFAESCGVAVDALQKLDEGKGQFLFFIGTKTGTNTVELLPRIVPRRRRRMAMGSGDSIGSDSESFNSLTTASRVCRSATSGGLIGIIGATPSAGAG